MSNKNKLRKKAREAREEKEAKSVFKWNNISYDISSYFNDVGNDF